MKIRDTALWIRRNTAQGIQNATNDWNPESKTILDSLTRGDQLKGLRHGWLVYFLNDKQLLDEVLVISGIIKVEVSLVLLSAEPKAEADNTYRDLDYLGYHTNRI